MTSVNLLRETLLVDVTAIIDDRLERFERVRLAAFAAHRFEGRGRRITDRTGGETYAIVRGDGPCPTVLVHGGIGSAAEWVMIAGRLEGPIIIPDRPGNGLTHPIDYREVDFRSDAARWLLELVDGLGVGQINLVGGSMGGFFAMAFAAAHPERVRRLTLTGAAVGLFGEFPLFLRLWANPVIGPLISRLRIHDAETLRKRVYSGYVAHPERIPADVLEVALAGLGIPGTSHTTQTMLHAVTTFRGRHAAACSWLQCEPHGWPVSPAIGNADTHDRTLTGTMHTPARRPGQDRGRSGEG